jgi:hypothetical protein
MIRDTQAAMTRVDASMSPQDPVALLLAHHAEMKALFEQYEGLVKQGADGEQKRALAETICWTLTVHTTAEEEVFYPAAGNTVDEQRLLHEATVENHSTRHLIADIVNMTPDAPSYDATVKVLGKYVEHHVRKAEGELFPKARASGLDMAALGKRIAVRKDELMAEAELES